MDSNVISIHLFLSRPGQNIQINFKDRTRDTRGFPEVMRFVVQGLVALNNNGKVITMEQAEKMLRSLAGEDLEIKILGGDVDE